MPPGRKAKGKQSEGLDANDARLVLQLLDRNEQLSLETLLRVFKLGQTSCPPACGTKGSKGSKDNPECFHGLMPAEGSFRKKGLWQKEPVLGQLGYDPADDERQGPDVPAGLRNLGNTCYVNAAMQFLQAIPEFRHALYVLEPELAEQDVIRQLRDLFIELHFGPRRYVDPEPFANSLQLNHAIQQDGQEFLKLLLTKLEHTFATSCQQEVRSVVQTLFRGHFSYVTTCRSCQQQSAAVHGRWSTTSCRCRCRAWPACATAWRLRWRLRSWWATTSTTAKAAGASAMLSARCSCAACHHTCACRCNGSSSTCRRWRRRRR
ncbi:hypothetical protein COO60DRAFT_1001184 [Scenedesmus sp. NREL 46B-D3]|nr:hypothetical protein COO60DRAFT_1001184 [Scenedesmus sp. NREL 46B-D3]